MKIYLAGKITGYKNYMRDFVRAEIALIKDGHIVLNPTVLPAGLEYWEYMHICRAMIDICDAVCLMPTWEESRGARLEHNYARKKQKGIIYYDPGLWECSPDALRAVFATLNE